MSMGTQCAPVYATLVMAFLEIKLYDEFHENFGIEARTKFQNEWMRYLDDCFIYWDTRIGPITDYTTSLITYMKTSNLRLKRAIKE